jgi:signal transduction histidine kinase
LTPQNKKDRAMHGLFYLFLKKKNLKKEPAFWIALSLLLLFVCCVNKKEARIDARLFTSDRYQKFNAVKKLQYLDSIGRHVSPQQNDSLTRTFYFSLAAEYYYLHASEKSRQIGQKVLQLSRSAGDTLSVARAYSYIGDSYDVSRKDSAYYYYLKGEKVYRSIGKTTQVARMLFNKAYILFFEGNYVESEVQLSKSLQLLTDKNDYQIVYSSYTLMGANLEKLEEYDGALKYYGLAKKVLVPMKKSADYSDGQYNYDVVGVLNVCNVYEKKHQYNKAIDELQQLLTPELKQKWPSEYSKVLANLAYSKMKSGQLSGLEQMFLEALEISRKYDSDADILYKLNNLGEYYFLTHENQKSQLYLNQTLAMAKKIRSSEEIKSALKLLARIDSGKNRYYQEFYIRLTDSLEKAQRRNRNKYARIEYETSVLENENKTLTLKNTRILLLSIVTVLVLALALIYRYFESKKKELRFIRQQQEAEEEVLELLKEEQLNIVRAKEIEKSRISMELHDGILNNLYGTRMQLGILNESDDPDIKARRLLYVDKLQEIENEIRSISHDLHIEKFNDVFDYGLLLGNLVNSSNEYGNTAFDYTCGPEIHWDDITGIIKITIYRILQEALLNVSKYASATACHVAIKTTENQELQVEISDNGIGFAIQSRGKGIGLENMKDRAKLIEAELKIESHSSVGTTITLTIPDSIP